MATAPQDKDRIIKLLHESILHLCKVSASGPGQTEVDGIVCITQDDGNQIVVRVHEKFGNIHNKDEDKDGGSGSAQKKRAGEEAAKDRHGLTPKRLRFEGDGRKGDGRSPGASPRDGSKKSQLSVDLTQEEGQGPRRARHGGSGDVIDLTEVPRAGGQAGMRLNISNVRSLGRNATGPMQYRQHAGRYPMANMAGGRGMRQVFPVRGNIYGGARGRPPMFLQRMGTPGRMGSPQRVGSVQQMQQMVYRQQAPGGATKVVPISGPIPHGSVTQAQGMGPQVGLSRNSPGPYGSQGQGQAGPVTTMGEAGSGGVGDQSAGSLASASPGLTAPGIGSGADTMGALASLAAPPPPPGGSGQGPPGAVPDSPGGVRPVVIRPDRCTSVLQTQPLMSPPPVASSSTSPSTPAEGPEEDAARAAPATPEGTASGTPTPPSGGDSSAQVGLETMATESESQSEASGEPGHEGAEDRTPLPAATAPGTRWYKCGYPECSFLTSTFGNLENHCLAHVAGKDGNPIHCGQANCDFTCASKQYLQTHFKITHGSRGEILICPGCLFGHPKKDVFERHKWVCRAEKRACHVCSQELPDLLSYASHLADHYRGLTEPRSRSSSRDSRRSPDTGQGDRSGSTGSTGESSTHEGQSPLGDGTLMPQKKEPASSPPQANDSENPMPVKRSGSSGDSDPGAISFSDQLFTPSLTHASLASPDPAWPSAPQNQSVNPHGASLSDPHVASQNPFNVIGQITPVSQVDSAGIIQARSMQYAAPSSSSDQWQQQQQQPQPHDPQQQSSMGHWPSTMQYQPGQMDYSRPAPNMVQPNYNQSQQAEYNPNWQDIQPKELLNDM